VKAKFKVEV